MAQLKDLVVNGASRFIGDIFGNKAQLTTLEAPTSAGGSTFGPGTNGQILKSNGSSLYWSDDNGGVTGVKGNAETAYRTGEVNLTAANILGSTAIGTSTTPVYWSGSAFTAGDKYAGGTAVTLNNASKAKTTASFYAPTTGGTNNTQALVGAGATTAPKWVNISTTLATSTAATASAGQKLKVTVLGQASSEVELSKATNALYGVTKLTDSYKSSDGTMATTGKALLAALQTLDVDAVGVAAATGNKFISQISETDGKISAAVSTATLGSTSLPVWVDGGVIKAITSYEGTAAKAIAANITSTDNAIVRFDGAEGKFQNSGVTIDDSNNISTAGDITTKSLYVFGTQTTNKTNRYITSDSTNNIYFSINSKIPLVITDTAVRSGSSVAGTIDLGASGNKWNNVYANKYYGDGTNITLGTASYAVVTDANKKLSAVSLAVSDPSAEGQTTTFIDSISQDATGKISATKKNLDTSGTWSGTAAKATAATITTAKNAVAYYSDTNGTFAAISNNTTSTQKFLSQANGGTPTWTTIPEQLSISQTSTGSYYVAGYSGTGTSLNYYTSVTINNGVLFGAAWNDYAEFRSTESVIEAGRCIKENGNDTLSLTTKRLERGCEIVSDTYGFAIGETTKCKTPIAVTGRVLAYPYEPREVFALHIGEPVCSGPNGTVSIMTEEEEEKYPSRIIGIISAVPDYEQWGTGDVEVNGRVWIRIK